MPFGIPGTPVPQAQPTPEPQPLAASKPMFGLPASAAAPKAAFGIPLAAAPPKPSQHAASFLEKVSDVLDVPLAYLEAGISDLGQPGPGGNPFAIGEGTHTKRVTQDLQHGGAHAVAQNDIYFRQGSLQRVLADPTATHDQKATAQWFLHHPWAAGAADFAGEFANPSNLILGPAVGAAGKVLRPAARLATKLPFVGEGIDAATNFGRSLVDKYWPLRKLSPKAAQLGRLSDAAARMATKHNTDLQAQIYGLKGAFKGTTAEERYEIWRRAHGMQPMRPEQLAQQFPHTPGFSGKPGTLTDAELNARAQMERNVLAHLDQEQLQRGWADTEDLMGDYFPIRPKQFYDEDAFERAAAPFAGMPGRVGAAGLRFRGPMLKSKTFLSPDEILQANERMGGSLLAKGADPANELLAHLNKVSGNIALDEFIRRLAAEAPEAARELTTEPLGYLTQPGQITKAAGFENITAEEPVLPPNGSQVLYRGDLASSPGERNLLRKRGILEAINPEKHPGFVPDNAPFYFFTESPKVAQKYANASQNALNGWRKYFQDQSRGREIDGKPGYTPEEIEQKAQEMYAHDYGAKPLSGKVNRYHVAADKTLDLTALGERPMYEDVMHHMARHDWPDMPPLDRRWTPEELQHWNDLDIERKLRMPARAAGENAEYFPVWRFFRNTKEEPQGAQAFHDWLVAHGYDSVKYRENGTTHTVVLDKKQFQPEGLTQTVTKRVPKQFTRDVPAGRVVMGQAEQLARKNATRIAVAKAIDQVMADTGLSRQDVARIVRRRFPNEQSLTKARNEALRAAKVAQKIKKPAMAATDAATNFASDLPRTEDIAHKQVKSMFDRAATLEQRLQDVERPIAEQYRKLRDDFYDSALPRAKDQALAAVTPQGYQLLKNVPGLSGLERLKYTALKPDLVDYLTKYGAPAKEASGLAAALDRFSALYRIGIVTNPIVHPFYNLLWGYLGSGGNPARLTRVFRSGETTLDREAEKYGAHAFFNPASALGGSNAQMLLGRFSQAPGMLGKADWALSRIANANRALVFDRIERNMATELWDDLAKKNIARGMDAETAKRMAGEQVRKAFGDYDNITSAERHIARAFYFYPWTKTVIPFWIKAGIKRPQMVTGPMRAIQTHNVLAGDTNVGKEKMGTVYMGKDANGQPVYKTVPLPQRWLEDVGEIAVPRVGGQADTSAGLAPRLNALSNIAFSHMTPGLNVAANTARQFANQEPQEPGVTPASGVVFNREAPMRTQLQQIGSYAAQQMLPFGGNTFNMAQALHEALKGVPQAIPQALLGGYVYSERTPQEQRMLNRYMTEFQRKYAHAYRFAPAQRARMQEQAYLMFRRKVDFLLQQKAIVYLTPQAS